MKISQFGSVEGRTVIYFHGAPGSPEECKIFDEEGKKHQLNFICLDRFAVDASLSGDAYYQHLALEVLKISEGKKVTIIGFSIGAFIALQTVRYMPNKVESLHLVSAAAPLEAGNYLEAMAGKQVFKLAKAEPTLFFLLSYWQAVLARFFPSALVQLLFASAAGEDKVLAANNEFKNSLSKILKECFVGNVRGYVRDVVLYVRPWKATLAQASLAEASVNTYIYHGSEDNWSPPTMAEYLKQALPNSSLKIFNGLSHYSCLYQAVSEIGEALNKK